LRLKHALVLFTTLCVTGASSGLWTLQAAGQSGAQSVCNIYVKDNYRYIDSNGIPNHATGQFPNRGNPNTISPQKYNLRVPLNPTPSEQQGHPRGYDFGVAVNGVMFDPGTAETWNNNMRWQYEALSGMFATRGSLGVDQNLAHVQPNGAYHYHGLPMGLLNKLDYRNKMVLVGWAADGYPIYGPFCYVDPKNSRSRLKEMKSSYRLKSGSRPGGNDSPGGAYDGSFSSDYEFVASAGDLDEFNGRTGVTPEFPKGTFYYVLTDNWPFVPRLFRGTPDATFRKGPPGGGRGFGPPGGMPGGGNGMRRPPGGMPGGDDMRPPPEGPGGPEE
jgi:hypothetical protein